MVKTSPSIAVCTPSTSPAVYLLSETPELEKDYYPALLDEAQKPREGQGSAHRDGARWMLSPPAALEVCRAGASSGVTLSSFQGDLSPEQACLSRSSVASTSKLPQASPAWSTEPGVVVCQLSLPHLQRAGRKRSTECAPPPCSHHRPLLTHFTAQGTSSKRDPALLGISGD